MRNKPADAIAGILPALGPVGAALEGAASAVVAAWAAGEVAVDVANWARRNIQDTGPELEARVAWTKNQANVFLLYGSIFGVPDRIRERSTREATAWLVRSSQKGDGAWPIRVRADRSERLANAWYDVNYPIIQTLRAGMWRRPYRPDTIPRWCRARRPGLDSHRRPNPAMSSTRHPVL